MGGEIKMSPNRRILLNIIATYGRSLYALVTGLFCPSMGSDPMEGQNRGKAR